MLRQILRSGPLPLSALLLSFGLNLLYMTLSILFFGEMYERSRAKGRAWDASSRVLWDRRPGRMRGGDRIGPR
jgi:hypothetical protein